MTLHECCRRDVVSLPPDAMVSEAVRLMEEKNVGCIIVTQNQKPIGILTDRDLVLRVMTKKMDPAETKVLDVMTRNPVVLSGELGLYDAMRGLQGKGYRRLPVVDGQGRLSGIITIDDMVRLLIRELSFVSTVLEEQTPAL